MKSLNLPISNKGIFPPQVLQLLHALDAIAFFKQSMLVGSWVMPLYQEAFGIQYQLRTMDIDFAIKFATKDKVREADLEKVITDLGYIPVIMQSGICKFTRENFSIEFIVHRKGGRNNDVVTIKKWNITAEPLPFVDILLEFPFIADFGDFRITAPIPEAYFVQKMITAQRRQDESKKEKDIDQCAAITGRIDQKRLAVVVGSLKPGVKTRKAMRTSCEAINFPLQKLGLK